MSLIFIVSAQHTGTWTTIHHVERSPDIEKVGMLSTTKPVVVDARTIADKKFCFHDHLSTNYLSANMVTPKCSRTTPVIIPVRDPLRSLMTRQSRAPNLEHVYIVQAFCQFQEISEKYNVMFFPIDLPHTTEERVAQLNDLYSFLGIARPTRTCINEAAVTWPASNPGVHFEKFQEATEAFTYMYAARDYGLIKQYVPTSTWILEQMQPVLQPFMESLGYQNLMWFK